MINKNYLLFIVFEHYNLISHIFQLHNHTVFCIITIYYLNNRKHNNSIFQSYKFIIYNTKYCLIISLAIHWFGSRINTRLFEPNNNIQENKWVSENNNYKEHDFPKL